MSVASNQSLSHSRLTSTTATSATAGSESTFDDEIKEFRRRETVFYPLFSAMAENFDIPNFLYYFTEIVVLVQFFISGFWPSSERAWETATDSNMVGALLYLVDFGYHTFSWKDTMPYYVVCFAYTLLFFCWHVFVLQNFQTTHNFSRLQLVITRVFELILTPIVLPVFATIAGGAFRQMGEEISTGSVDVKSCLFLILSLCCTAGLFVVYWIVFGFCCASPILFFQGLHASWDPLPVHLMMAGTLWTCFWSSVLDEFQSWICVVFIAASIASDIWSIILVRSLPFQVFAFNGVAAGFCTTHSVCQLLSLFAFFGIDLPDIVFVIISLLALIGSIIGFVVGFGVRKRSLANQMSYDEIQPEGKITDAEKRTYFESLEFHSNREIYEYLRVGIACNCELFLDFSFPHYIIENYATPDVLLRTTQMVSFFPSQLQFLGYCLASIAKLERLSLVDHFLCYQMRKVHVMRQSSLSKEASVNIRKIRKQANDAISTIRGFWLDILNQPQRLDIASLNAIYNLGKKVNGDFCDLEERFANNQELYQEYSHFLIEAMGDYVEAGKLVVKAHQLELGKRLDTDYAFTSLVNTYPHYLIEEIVDAQGNMITAEKVVRDPNKSDVSSLSFSNWQQQEQQLEQMAKDVIKESGLRISTQQSLDKSEILHLPGLKGFVYFQIALSILVSIVLMIVVVPIQDKTDTLMEEVRTISNAYANIVYGVFASCLTYASNKGYFSGETAIEARGIPSTEDFQILPDIAEQAYSVTRTAKAHFQDFAESIISHRSSRSNVADLLFGETQDVQYVSSGVITDWSVTVTVRSGLLQLLDYCAMGASAVIANPSSSSGLDYLLMGSWGLIDAVDYYEAAKSMMTEDGRETIETFRSLFSVMRILLPILFGVVFLIINIIMLWRFYNRVDVLFEAMKSVKKDVVDESLLPISRHTKDKKIASGSSQLVRKGNWAYYTIAILMVIVSIINAIGLALPFILSVGKLSDMDALLEWYDLAATRLGSMLHFMACAALYPPIALQNSDVVETVVDRMTESYTRFRAAHYALLLGSEKFDGLIGFNTDLDEEQFLDNCDEVLDAYYLLGKCLSIDRQVLQASIFAENMLITFPAATEESDIEALLDGETFVDLLALMDGGGNMRMYLYQESILTKCEYNFNHMTDYLLIIPIIVVIINIIAVIALVFVFLQFEYAEGAVRQLIRLLPPKHVVRNYQLLEVIVEPNESAEARVFTPSETIVQQSKHAVVHVGLDLAINSVNQAFQNITGMTPSEVLGQNLNVVFPYPTEDNGDSSTSVTQLYDALESMKQGQQRHAVTCHMKCAGDYGRSLDVKVLIVPVINDDVLECFALLIEDLSQLNSQEQESRNVKRRCDKVMSHIIPMEVYQTTRRTQETTMLFVSSSATVVWVEITGLLDCVESLSPSRMIETLRSVYEAFDEVCGHYQAVHRLMCNDYTMIACAGLFDFEDQANQQIEQCVLACIELGQMRDDLNERLSLALDFRFGVAYGGMLAGRILSEDTPAFDLEGPMLDEATSLAELGEPGQVSVNESAAQLLNRQQFSVEKGPIDKHQTLQYYNVEIL